MSVWDKQDTAKLVDYLISKTEFISRGRIVSFTEIKWTTVYEILSGLEMEGLVEKRYRKRYAGPGRPKTVWKLKPGKLEYIINKLDEANCK
jgi:predicted ArsR family transcriptional regulator